MYAIVASVLKYLFVVLIYLFIYHVMRLVYLDIRAMTAEEPPDTAPKKRRGKAPAAEPQLPLQTAKQPRPAQLVWITGKASGPDIVVAPAYPLGRQAVIGRAKNCAISIADPFLSSRHARLSDSDGFYVLEDLGSTNGTKVNGRKLNPNDKRKLKDGDRLQFGQLEFRFEGGVTGE